MSKSASGRISIAPPKIRGLAGAFQGWRVWLAALVIVLAGLAAYSDSLRGPFIFDDVPAITENPTIRQGWWPALFPPTDGQTVTGRPLVNISFALNYDVGGYQLVVNHGQGGWGWPPFSLKYVGGGYQVWGYHAANLAIHLIASLVLFGLLRRTFAGPALRARWGETALPLALAAALWWALHPLLIESVTYMVQRAEAMMALFYLLTLYCFVRGVESTVNWLWYGLSVLACFLGMLCKEVMVSAPLMVLLYDRTFVAGTFAQAWSRRWKYYATLACVWLPLAWLVATEGNRGKSAGFGADVGMVEYAQSQFGAIIKYLWLSVWPNPLVLDYGQNLEHDPWVILPCALAVVALAGGTIYALWKWPLLGFLGAWFFAILAPSSSIVPVVTQTMAEHRMYLPLAALAALAAVGLQCLLGRRGYIAVLILAVALGALTFERNRDYRTSISIWSDSVDKLPDNSRAHKNLGIALEAKGRKLESLARYQNAVQLNPDNTDAENNWGNTLLELGRNTEAVVHYERAIKLNPYLVAAHYNLGNAYHAVNQPEKARDEYVRAIRLYPNYAAAHNNLGNIYVDNFGLVDQAETEYQAAIRIDPNLPEAHNGLGLIFLRTNRPADAIPQFAAAIKIKPDYSDAYLGLGNAFVLANQAGPPVSLAAVVRLLPEIADVHAHFAADLLQMKRFDDAVVELQETLRLNSNYPGALNALVQARQLAQQPSPGILK